MNYYKQVWYPDLQPRRPPLSVTLHTDSFVKAEGTDVQIRDWLIAEGQHTNHKDGRKYIDLIVTAARGRQNVEWVSELPRLESIGRTTLTGGQVRISPKLGKKQDLL